MKNLKFEEWTEALELLGVTLPDDVNSPSQVRLQLVSGEAVRRWRGMGVKKRKAICLLVGTGKEKYGR